MDLLEMKNEYNEKTVLSYYKREEKHKKWKIIIFIGIEVA